MVARLIRPVYCSTFRLGRHVCSRGTSRSPFHAPATGASFCLAFRCRCTGALGRVGDAPYNILCVMSTRLCNIATRHSISLLPLRGGLGHLCACESVSCGAGLSVAPISGGSNACGAWGGWVVCARCAVRYPGCGVWRCGRWRVACDCGFLMMRDCCIKIFACPWWGEGVFARVLWWGDVE